MNKKQSEHAHVAQLIKKELRERYPLTEWRVKSSIFAGGDSVDVSYTDGPTSHQVQEMLDKYVNSTFDCMTDCSNYVEPNYGGSGVRFASANRHYSKEAEDVARARLVKLYDLQGLTDQDPIPDNWRVGGYYCIDQLIGHELQDMDLYPHGPQTPAPNPDRRAEIAAIVDDPAQPEPTPYVIKPSGTVCLTPTATTDPLDEVSPFTERDIDRLVDLLMVEIVKRNDPPEEIKFVVGK
jgi:hypothetical protein